MRLKSIFYTFILLLLMHTLKADTQPVIKFELSFEKPHTHYTEVIMNIDGLDKEYVDLKMPVWTPGSYLIREFEKSVESFQAAANGQSLRVKKINKNTWRIWNQNAKQTQISYKVYGFERSVRTTLIDDTHAFISPTGVFMFIDGHLELPSTVKVNLPDQWSSISTGLPSYNNSNDTFYAADFDILYDSPIEIGNQDIFTFEAAGVHHTVAMYNAKVPVYDKEKLRKGMAKIVAQESKLFGENPNKNYTFIVHNYEQGSGGLEHLNSTVLGVQRDSYATEEGYKKFLELVAHEYFHLWNVKRLRPEALDPFNYNEEIYTHELWIAEGLTSYFENKFMVRAGYYTPEQFLKNYMGTVGTVVNQPGVKYQSVTESSFDAWIKGYRPNENSINIGISYYTKGTVIGMMLDLAIVNATKGKKSLDDVMYTAYQRFYKNRKNGYTGQEFKQLIEEISGVSFDDFYAKYVDGMADLDYNTFLEYVGYQFENIADASEVSLGILAVNGGGQALVRSVLRDGSAWDGGISAEDFVIAINGNRITQTNLDVYVQQMKVGDHVEMAVIRDGVERTFAFPLKPSNKVKLELRQSNKPSKTQLALRKTWIGD